MVLPSVTFPTCCSRTESAAVRPTVVRTLRTESVDLLLLPSLSFLLLSHLPPLLPLPLLQIRPLC